MSRLWRRLIVVTILAVAVFAAFSIYADVSKLGARLGALAAWPVLAALALALGNYVIRFVRWELYLKTVGEEPPRGTSALVFFAGFSMSVTPGKVGELLKAVLLRDAAGVPVARTAPVVVAERITDLLALVVLVLCGVAAYGVSGYGIALPMVLVAGALTVAGIAALAYRPFGHWVLDRIARFKRLARLAARLREVYDNMAPLLRPGTLAWSTALGALAWLCECIGFAVVIGGFPGASVPLGLAVVIYAATTIAGALSFLPGGLVVTEASMVALLVASAHGIDQPTAVAATIVTRLCTLWFAVVLGLAALAVLRWLRPATRQALADASPPAPAEGSSTLRP